MGHFRFVKGARPDVYSGPTDTTIARDLEAPMARLRKASIAGFEIENILRDVAEHRHPAPVLTFVSRNGERAIVKRLFDLIDLNALISYAGMGAVERILGRYQLTRD